MKQVQKMTTGVLYALLCVVAPDKRKGEKCPECGSSNYWSVPRGEHCDDCGYDVYYP